MKIDFSLLSNSAYQIKNVGIRFIQQNPYVAIITTIALAIIPLISYLYKKIINIPHLPFDHWAVSLGIISRKTFTEEEKNDIRSFILVNDTTKLNTLLEKYSPVQLTEKISP